MRKVSQGKAVGGVALLAAVLAAGIGTAAAGDKYKFANEGTIGKDWKLAPGVELAVPGYPEAFAQRADNVCLALGYAINPDGSTSDFAVLKSWSNGVAADGKEPAPGYWDAFAQAGAHAVSKWKFQPREATPTRATYTVATLYFNGREAMEPASLRGHCAVGDLATLIQEQLDARLVTSGEKQRRENAVHAASGRRIDAGQLALERLPKR